MASAMNITAKYLICIIDLRRAQRRGGEHAPPWQNKSMWVFYVELVTGVSTPCRIVSPCLLITPFQIS
jgi:hypothetical protein